MQFSSGWLWFRATSAGVRARADDPQLVHAAVDQLGLVEAGAERQAVSCRRNRLLHC